MRIQHNIAAMNSLRQLTGNNNTVSKSLEKLSSGYRINRAGDDAAGLAISEKMRAQIRGLSMASKNAQDGISLVQTAEGALTETHSILQRMRELAVQASNGIYDNNDRSQTQAEIDALKEEVDRISTATTFNNIKILDGSQSAECAAAKENAARQEAANAELAEQNAAIAANNQAKLDAAQAEYDAAKAEYDANNAKIVTNEDFQATATYKDGTPLSAAAAGSKASMTINISDVEKEATQEETTLTFANLATGNKFGATATLEIDGVEINIAKDETLADVMDKINQDATLGAKYTAQVNDDDLVLTNRTAGAAEDAKVKLSGGGTITLATSVTTQGKDAGVTAFKAGESLTIAGQKFTFYDSGVKTPTAKDGEVLVDIHDRDTAQLQMEALTVAVANKLDGKYEITAIGGTAEKTVGVRESLTVDLGGTVDGAGNLVLNNLLDDGNAGYANATIALEIGDTNQTVVDKINALENSLYTAELDANGKVLLKSKELVNLTDVAYGTNTVTVNNGTAAQDPAALGAITQGKAAVVVDAAKERLTVDLGGTVDGAGDLVLNNLLEGASAGTYANATIALAIGDTNQTVVEKINALENSLYTAELDANGKVALTAKKVGDLTSDVAYGTNTVTVNNGTAAQDPAALGAVTNGKPGSPVTSFTLTAKTVGEDPNLTELQYTSETKDGGVTIGTKGPFYSDVTAGVNPSEALEAKNATVTYELNLGDKSEITNGSEVTIAGKTFKIFNSDKAVVEAGATMNESIVLENAQDEVEFTFATALTKANTITAGKNVLEIAGQKFTLEGNNEAEMIANLQSAFEQSDLADKYELTIGYSGTVAAPGTITNIKFAAKDAATDVSALEVKFDGTAITGQNKAVTTGEEKLATAIQNKVSALTGIVNTVTIKDNQITFEAEFSDVTGAEFMETMGQLGFNANVEAAPEKAEVELEEALVGEYEKVTAEDMDNGVTFQIGANGDADQRVKLQIGDMGAKALGIADVDLTTSDGANKAIDVIDAAIQNVSAQRAQLGAMQNRLEHTINNLDTNNENLSAAESRIRDVDMAAEMMAYTKNNVLVQAAQSMLAQANQQPQSVLSLLQ